MSRFPLGRPLTVIVVAIAILCAAPSLLARDILEPLPMADPFRHSVEPGLVPGAYVDTAYHGHVFISGTYDDFSIRQRAVTALFATRDFVNSLYFSSLLFGGPTPAGASDPSITGQISHSVQFEYGLLFGLRVPAPLSSVVLEYGRTSLHPLSSGPSEVATDLVRLSLWSRDVRTGSLTAAAGLRLSYVDLFDFWQSVLLKPRSRFIHALHVDLRYDLAPLPASHLSLYSTIEPRLHFMRSEGQWPWADVDPSVQSSLDAEVGVRIVGRARFELFVDFYTTQDSEQRRGEAYPLTTLGFGFRVGGLTGRR